MYRLSHIGYGRKAPFSIPDSDSVLVPPPGLTLTAGSLPSGWEAVGDPLFAGNCYYFSNDGSQYINSASDLFDNDFTIVVAMEITNDPDATFTFSSNYYSATITTTEAVIDTPTGVLSATNPGIGNRIVIIGYGDGRVHFMIGTATDNSRLSDPYTVVGTDAGTQIGGGHNFYEARCYLGWLNQQQRQVVIDEMSALYF